jgi:glycosyltransferase involved in cell wall biosynthesis
MFDADACLVQRNYNLPDRFFLVANQFWTHKNHLLVLQALKQLSKCGLRPTVVFTGNLHDYRAPGHMDKILQEIHQLAIHSQVILLGVVPRGHYLQLMRRCLAVIQPSLFEGWSTIVEDARALGKPLLLSDLDVHLEQNPPDAEYFARHSVENLAALMKQKWQHLAPGPDLEAEDAARRQNAKDLRRVGEQFLTIARDDCLSS